MFRIMLKVLALILMITLYVQNSSFAEDERILLSNSQAFGDFRHAKKIKKSAKETLEVWDSYIKHIDKNFGPAKYRISRIDIEYDEVWIRERTDNLTRDEINQSKGKLDLIKLYWKGNKIQGGSVESLYISDPYTNQSFSKPAYKIRSLFDRDSILKDVAP